jgi:hypothetical protein
VAGKPVYTDPQFAKIERLPVVGLTLRTAK